MCLVSVFAPGNLGLGVRKPFGLDYAFPVFSASNSTLKLASMGCQPSPHLTLPANAFVRFVTFVVFCCG